MCKVFYYKSYDFDVTSGVLSLTYSAENKYSFTETLTFPGAPFNLNTPQKEALKSVLFLTHIAFGISYYKAFLPKDLVIESGALTCSEAAFFDTFYLNGLGEFSVKNNVDLDIHFPFDEGATRTYVDLALADKTLVPIGGGKDSCVTIELLKATGKNITAFSLRNPCPIKECVSVSGLNHLILNRQIAPELLRLNETETIYNGHVPITGLIAFLLWISAILYNYRFAAMSCERSANVGNMVKNGREVNHQYSKSIVFEKDFRNLTQTITPDFRYFSMLQPLSEMHIAKLFSALCAPYFGVFTSCNKAFKLDETKRLNHWCGTCDKCRFVFLMLAPFMDKKRLIQVVGTNPLDDKKQLTGFKELLNLLGHKPFECVGEVAECRYAFTLLAQNSEWNNDYIIKELSNDIHQKVDDIFTPSNNHLIPKEFADVMVRFKK